MIPCAAQRAPPSAACSSPLAPEKTMSNSTFSEDFFKYLQKRSESDTSVVGTLRRSLMLDPGTDCRAFPLVERWTSDGSNSDCPRKDNPGRRYAIYLAAGLWSLTSRQNKGKSATPFPKAMRRICKKSDSIEKRFTTLLDADMDELGWRLRSAVQLVSSEGIALDWPKLLDDLLKWQYRKRPVQIRWARHFWGEPVETAT